ncbi:MAG: hypothetical protein KQJ78_12420 [Deltaproteobacteria bacterium]|nr:hypothetical protein [Deltaproteobacteria bacterium]
MAPHPQPQGPTAQRNFACKSYETCLNQADSAGWPGFSCEACSLCDHEPNDWRQRQQDDMEPLLELWAEVFGRPVRRLMRSGSPEDPPDVRSLLAWWEQ